MPRLDMMLRSVNQRAGQLRGAAQNRDPLRHRTAFAFHPGLPDRTPIKGPQRFETTIAQSQHRQSARRISKTWPSGRSRELAPLVRSRAVSSTDLTKMYLARMKKYSPKLLCLITLTEDLALRAGRRGR